MYVYIYIYNVLIRTQSHIYHFSEYEHIYLCNYLFIDVYICWYQTNEKQPPLDTTCFLQTAAAGHKSQFPYTTIYTTLRSVLPMATSQFSLSSKEVSHLANLLVEKGTNKRKPVVTINSTKEYMFNIFIFNAYICIQI